MTPRTSTGSNDDGDDGIDAGERSGMFAPADGPSLFGDDPAPASGAKPYVVLARKYRPRTFDDLIGQEAMVRTLTNAFAVDRIAQGYMLTGVRGVGKTTTARILARALNYARDAGSGRPAVDRPAIDMPVLGRHCAEIIESRHPDVVEMDAASNTGVDNIREIIESARYKPLVARYKVFIIDEVHMLSKGAFNALLKTLEEPPGHVKFIFATTEVRKVPVTVLSRCQRFDLRRVDVPVLSQHFARIVAAESARAEPQALALIARAAEGSVRDGLSILDQAIATSLGEAAETGVTEAQVRGMLGLADRGRIFDLLEHLARGAAGDALNAFAALHRDGGDAVEILADLAEAVHAAARVKTVGVEAAGEALSAEEARRSASLAAKLSVPLLSRLWQMLIKGLEDANRAPDPGAAAEMVLIRIAHTADLPSPDEVIRALGGAGPRRSDAGAAQTGSHAGGSGSRAGGESGGGPDRGPPDRTPPDRAPLERPPWNAATAAAAATDPALLVAEARGPAAPSAAPRVIPRRPLDDETENPAPPLLDDDFVGDAEEAEALVTQARLPDPRTFDEVVALVGLKRDIKLKLHLEEHVSLVRFDAATDSIDLFLLPGAPTELPNDLREKLVRWTAKRWIVMVSRAAGARPIAEVRREREATELEELKGHPAVKAVMAAFPEARIAAVRPLAVLPDEVPDESATG